MSLVLAHELYTDGSVFPNPGPGGWAVVDHNYELVAEGHASHTTNIAMEGMAIRAALLHLYDNKLQGIIWTDSEFWVKVLYEWGPRWARGGWQKPTNNTALARELFYAHSKLRNQIKVKWLKGHNGHPGNEAADRAANEARRSADAHSGTGR